MRLFEKRSAAAKALAALLVVGTTACAPVVATRGNLIDDERLARVAVGRSNVNDVASVFGSPTTVSTFDRSTWYYVGQRTEKLAFFDPEIVERRVIRVEFSDTGIVREVDDLDLEDAQVVELVDRETPTLGRSIGVLEQLLGNFGRFNTPTAGGVGRGGPGQR